MRQWKSVSLLRTLSGERESGVSPRVSNPIHAHLLDVRAMIEKIMNGLQAKALFDFGIRA